MSLDTKSSLSTSVLGRENYGKLAEKHLIKNSPIRPDEKNHPDLDRLTGSDYTFAIVCGLINVGVAVTSAYALYKLGELAYPYFSN